jgi:hypothetical protein
MNGFYHEDAYALLLPPAGLDLNRATVEMVRPRFPVIELRGDEAHPVRWSSSGWNHLPSHFGDIYGQQRTRRRAQTGRSTEAARSSRVRKTAW